MDSIVTFCAKYLVIAVVLIWAFAWVKASRKYKFEITLATALAVIIAAIIDKIAGKLYYDPRPFVSHHVTPLFRHAADNGFPSEHTLFSVTIAASLFFYRPKLGVLAFVIAIIVGSARVAAHVHSPIDIIGGIVIGLIAGWVGYFLARFVIARSRPQTKSDQAGN